ncbi:MAG TPA: GNAT family N-acetyltransferase [Puia sp.]|nr:GNAT family N-acetyltransferase [Puia sp.]
MSKAFPVYRTGRLLLRHFTESDLENVYLGLSNPEVIKYYGVHFKTLEETRKQLEWFANLERDETGIWWAVCSTDNLTFYGSVGVYYLNKESGKAELGFWLMPDFWGKGIITESLQLAIEHGFNKMHLKKIEAEVETENEKSKNVLKKLQFIHTSTKKDCEIKNGRYISLDIFTLEA